jgi:hypothetical protein
VLLTVGGTLKNSPLSAVQTVGVFAYLQRLIPPTSAMLSGTGWGFKNKMFFDYLPIITLPSLSKMAGNSAKVSEAI